MKNHSSFTTLGLLLLSLCDVAFAGSGYTPDILSMTLTTLFDLGLGLFLGALIGLALRDIRRKSHLESTD